jgi:hypothetical protein
MCPMLINPMVPNENDPYIHHLKTIAPPTNHVVLLLINFTVLDNPYNSYKSYFPRVNNAYKFYGLYVNESFTPHANNPYNICNPRDHHSINRYNLYVPYDIHLMDLMLLSL